MTKIFSRFSARGVSSRISTCFSIVFDFSEKLYIANHVAGYEPPREQLLLRFIPCLVFLTFSSSPSLSSYTWNMKFLSFGRIRLFFFPDYFPFSLSFSSPFFPFSPIISLSLRHESHLIRSYLFLLMQFRLFAAIIFMLLSAKLIVSRYSFRSDAVENGLAYLRGNG